MKEEEQNIFKGLKKFILTEVREKKKGYINPVIVTFQNGELKEQHAEKFNVSLTPSGDGKTNVEIRTSDDNVFVDSNFNSNFFSKQNIAIRNKKTNKVKIVEVDSAVLINSALLDAPKTETVVDYAKDAKTLRKTFGGKKIVTRLEQREKLSISTSLVADEVKKAIIDIEVEDNFPLNNTEEESIIHLLPPCHREVKVLSNVYILNEILSDEELLDLKQELKSIEECKDTKENSLFFNDCVTEAKKSDENIDNRLAGILFAESLIKFLKLSSKKIASKNAILCSFSTVIHKKLLDEFCIKTTNSVTRPVTMRDKSLCFIIVLGLICCNYQVNLKVLSLTTGIHFNRLTRLARVVGAVPLSKNENIFILKLPLPALPKTSKGRVKRQ